MVMTAPKNGKLTASPGQEDFGRKLDISRENSSAAPLSFLSQISCSAARTEPQPPVLRLLIFYRGKTSQKILYKILFTTPLKFCRRKSALPKYDPPYLKRPILPAAKGKGI